MAEPLREMPPGAPASESVPPALPRPVTGQPGAVSASSIASEPPRRVTGTRSRAGNAMARTRAGLLDGALRAVAGQGTRRTTMNDIAASAGVAKATLYNHFRTKTDVWHALIEAELAELAADCAALPLADALALAATRIGNHPVVRRIAAAEPAVLAALLTAGPAAAGWRQAREAVDRQLAAAGRTGTDLVLRWLVSYLSEPAEPDAIAFAAECLVRGLPSAAAAT